MSGQFPDNSSLSARFGALLALFSLLGGALSVVSVYHFMLLSHGLQSGPSFCNIGAAFNCDLVNSSAWSTLFGISLGAYGLAFYLCLFFLAIYAVYPGMVEPVKARDSLLFVSSLASLLSLYLFYVSEVLIGTLCLVCLGMYIANFSLLGLAVLIIRPCRFAESFMKGASTLAALPTQLLNSKQRASLLAGLMGCLVAVLLSLFSEKLLLAAIGPKKSNAEIQKEIKGIVALWSAAKSDSISLQTDGAEIDYSKGDIDAPIQIVEFSDFECPACRFFFRNFEKINLEYPGKIRLTLRNFPLDSSCNLKIPQGGGHANACLAAFVARCAGEQDKYWEAADFLFSMPNSHEQAPSEVRAQMLNAPQVLGLDKQGFDECLAAERTKNKIQSDISQGVALGVVGTPSVWINNRKIINFSPPVLKAIFDDILSKK